MPQSAHQTITIGITGASGAIYAQTLLRLLDADTRVSHVYLVTTEAGLRLISTELNIVATTQKNSPHSSPARPQKKSNTSKIKTSAQPSPQAAP